ncbi:hypothetical protein MUCCIDRAFT_80058 [Mucor lusitanicus CBS 277.49]|uniref:Uncharacterized protein n=1 Tax=Mucor lusitanicus CBS 277.49 TaxID=747725 RepID=A0A168MI07_MUCCL|nr:hypothetical protein MUCCIDRAFT_80058 [Mucor lusitanicus CBS 277.49]
MDDVLSYSRYSEVICIRMCFVIDFYDPYFNVSDISCNGDVRTYRSLNKFINVEPIKYHSGEKIRFCCYLPDGFGPHPKYNGEDIPTTTRIPAMVISFFNEIKQDLRATLGQNFAESQFLVIAPIEWRNFNYKIGLRLIFKRAGWFLDNDHSNRLIITNFLKGFVYYLQSTASVPKFERDRRYIHCNIDRRSSEIYVSLTHYHIFNLKGLRRVSMKLATEDTLLTPSILDYQQIKIPSISDILTPPIRSLIAQRIPLSIMERGSPVSRGFASYEDLINHIVEDVMNNESLSILQLLPGSYQEDDQLQAMLGTIFCEDVMDAFYDSRDFILEMTKISEAIVKTVAMFTSQTTAEDSIRNVFLYLSQVNDDAITFFQDTIKRFLFYANFFGPSPNIFTGTHTNFGEEVFQGAMMMPYTMIQIANTLLPPQITTRDTNLSSHADSRLVLELLQKSKQCKNTDLLPPNSFYVQAHIYDNCVHFILNKVIEVTTNGGLQKAAFTATKEHIIKIDTMLDLAYESVWNHLQTVEEQLIACNQQDCTRYSSISSLDWKNYNAFETNFKAAFGSKKANDNEALDTSIPIAISDICGCSMVITSRLLQDIGLNSALQALAAIVASSISSNSLFGLYNVSALIVTDNFWKQKYAIKLCNPTYFTSILRKQVHANLQAHSKRPAVIFGIEELLASNYLGSWEGSSNRIIDNTMYRQVSSTGYMLELFSPDVSVSHPELEVYQAHPTFCQNLEYRKREELPYIDITVSKRGDSLDENGDSTTIKVMLQDGKSYSIEDLADQDK